MPATKSMDALETLYYLIRTESSCVRFGDGELSILTNTGHPGFQKNSDELRARLQEVITTKNNKMLVCLTGTVNYKTLAIYTSRAQYHFRNVIFLFHKYLASIINPNSIYGDTQFTRPYMDTLNKEYASKIFELTKKLFADKVLVIIEGSKTRFGLGNDLLSSSKNSLRIVAPATNAFDKYDEILQQALIVGSKLKSDTSSTDILFLIALGPTSKPLVLDLTNAGYRAIDIGHLDIEYEWYLRGARTKIPIPGKYVNETKEGDVWSENENLDFVKYNHEVIAKIES